MDRTRVRDLMTREVDFLDADEEIELGRLLRRFRRFRHLPVVSDDRVVGMISRTDVLEQATLTTPPRFMRVRELMSEPVHAAREDEPLTQAAARMIRTGVHALPVLDPEGSLAGIITETDILAALAGSHLAPPAELPVDALMSRPVVSIAPDAPLSEAAGLLVAEEIRHLAVVDGRRLVGLLSERDLRTRLGVELERWPDAPEDLLELQVSEVMVQNPITIQSGTALEAAAQSFAEERIGALPVVDELGRVIGMLSYVDLCAWLGSRGAREEAHAPQ